MRTLKKTLSLVLVVAMVLGLCVVGASAYNKVEDFTDDVDKIGDAYYEAVGVLTGIGIIDGMTETAFEPQGNYTREQAAKIIAYMQLGKEKADSLKCTVAPFEDVAASRWSAGYIAYCVEQGIIDGMTETTFEPTAKLTGFQWAKMLLCAVGFGVNGEFTGSSWSVNTAKVAHTVDLFAGDLAGADHTALTREQAALYAFNVLTSVDKVAYSPNVTSYVYGIQGYETVNGIGHTLGEDVFGLESDTGIITANEGTGAKYTTLSTDYENGKVVANIDADTSADMYYHAARIWSVKGVSVFVYDLAKVTEYNCAIDAGKAAANKAGAKTKILGEGTAYELDLIDNTAYAKNSYGAVTFKYNVGELGVTTTAGVTYLYNQGGASTVATIKAANLWTDISKINKGSAVIYFTHGGQYYIYAPSVVSGTVKGYNNSNYAITLTDGTVLAKSALGTAASVANVGQTYSIVLDTHGHYMWLTKSGVANLYFYTGEFKVTSDFNSYHGEHTYSAQFINVTTGEVVDLPVLASFVLDNRTLTERGYYDVDVADASGVYRPKEITPEKIYENTYALGNNVSFDATTIAKTVAGTKVYLDNPTKFIIASGSGSKVTVNTYDSLADMLKSFTGNSVTFATAAMTIYYSSTKNAACNVVFGYLPDYTSTGTNLFLPADLKAGSWNYDIVDGYSYDGFYLNGAPVTVYVTGQNVRDLNRGFYNFTISNGKWILFEQQSDNYVGLVTLRKVSNAVYFEVAGKDIPVTSDPVVVDLRDGYKGTDKAISDIDTLVNQYRDMSVTVGYTTNGSAINVVYVLDAGWQAKLTINLTSELINAGWRIVDGNDLVKSVTFTDKAATDKGGANYTVTLYNDNLKGMSGGNFNTAEVNGTDETTSSLADGKVTVTFYVAPIGTSARDFTYTIGGLELGDIVLTFGSASGTINVTSGDLKGVVLGERIDLKLSKVDGTQFRLDDNTVVPSYYTWTGTATNGGHTASLTGTISSDSCVIATGFYPLNAGTYDVAGTAWKNPNA